MKRSTARDLRRQLPGLSSAATTGTNDAPEPAKRRGASLGGPVKFLTDRLVDQISVSDDDVERPDKGSEWELLKAAIQPGDQIRIFCSPSVRVLWVRRSGVRVFFDAN